MAKNNTVKFYLEKRKDAKTGKTSTENLRIRLQFSFKGERLDFYPSYRVDENQWDTVRMQVKKGVKDYAQINKELEELAQKIYKEIDRAKYFNEDIDISDLKNVLYGKKDTKSIKSMHEALDEYIESLTLSLNKSTITKYESFVSKIKRFEKASGIKLEFKNINRHFYDSLKEYEFKVLGTTNNTFSTTIQVLKTFMNWATDKKYNTNLEFREKYFKKIIFEKEIIYLTFDELEHFYNFKFKDPKHSQIRDMYCFGSATGQRLSDIMGLLPENITQDNILYRANKTDEVNIIPLNYMSKSILAKYKGKHPDRCFPPFTKLLNDCTLREAAKEAGLNRRVQLTRFRGAEKIKIVAPLHEILVFHNSKKTFMTNFLARGGSLLTAMSITGNKDFKTAQRYYTVVNEIKTSEMAKVFNSK